MAGMDESGLGVSWAFAGAMPGRRKSAVAMAAKVRRKEFMRERLFLNTTEGLEGKGKHGQGAARASRMGEKVSLFSDREFGRVAGVGDSPCAGPLIDIHAFPSPD